MAQPFGPDFLKNLNAELDTLSRSASDRAQDEPAPQQPTPKPLLRGQPGSVERMQQVAELTKDDPSLIAELGWAQVGTALENALHQIRPDEQREEFYDSELPAYRPETVEAFASAARMLASVGDPQLYAAFAHELGEDSPIAEYLPSAVEFAETKGRIEDYGLAKAAEEKRMSEREQVLRREYQDIERRTGPTGLAAADQLAQNLNAEGLLYHPSAPDDLLRAEMRAVSEQSRTNERGLRQGAFLTEFDNEVARKHGPGSSWNDEEREKWESEYRMGTVEAVERAFRPPRGCRRPRDQRDDRGRRSPQNREGAFGARARRRVRGDVFAHPAGIPAPEEGG